jgi:Domain of unknown function (DUF4397)
MTATSVALPMGSTVKSFALVLGSAMTLALTVSLAFGGELQPAGAQSRQAKDSVAVATSSLPASVETKHAFVRVAHMSGNRTPLTVLVNGTVLSQELPVGQKTSYLPVGQRLVDVVLRNTVSDNSQTVSVRQLGKGIHATVFPRPSGTRPAAILVIDNVPTARPQSAAIRFVHLSEDSDDLEVTTDNRVTAIDRLRSTEFQFVSSGTQVMTVKTKPAEGAKSLLDFQFEAIDQSALTFVLSDGPTGLSVAVIDERRSQDEDLAHQASIESVATLAVPNSDTSTAGTLLPATAPTISTPTISTPTISTPAASTPAISRPQPPSLKPNGSIPPDDQEPRIPQTGPGELALTLDELNGSSRGPAEGAVAILSVAGVALAVGDRRRRNFNNRP